LKRRILERHDTRVISLARGAVRRVVGYPFIANANKVNESEYSKRALLVYVTKAFMIKDDDPLFYGHQNFKQCRNIATVLDELGYVVDVAHFLDVRFRPRRKYDLLINHRVSLGLLENGLRAGTRKVYLASGMNHIRRNAIIREAYAQLANRRGCKLRMPVPHPEDMPFVTMADAIVGFGNAYTTGSWADVFDRAIYPFNNYGWSSTPSSILLKDFESSRRSFIFFASGPQVRKGLDLLLDVFPRFPDLHLFVCSPFESEPDFCACYQKELYGSPNVHPIGWVSVNSGEFNDLMAKCAFVIHPAREEGQPGSVVQCMYAGLIPLVSLESGIDTEDFGITFRENTLAQISDVIQHVSNCSTETLLGMSQNTRNACEAKFSEASFISRWKSILTEICNSDS
jgi:glycosyltransferase involved in cell wall biosynthesis